MDIRIQKLQDQVKLKKYSGTVWWVLQQCGDRFLSLRQAPPPLKSKTSSSLPPSNQKSTPAYEFKRRNDQKERKNCPPLRQHLEFSPSKNPPHSTLGFSRLQNKKYSKHSFFLYSSIRFSQFLTKLAYLLFWVSKRCVLTKLVSIYNYTLVQKTYAKCVTFSSNYYFINNVKFYNKVCGVLSQGESPHTSMYVFTTYDVINCCQEASISDTVISSDCGLDGRWIWFSCATRGVRTSVGCPSTILCH